MIEEIDSLVTEYYRTDNGDLIKAIYVKSRSYIDEWISYQASSLRDLTDEARQDLALTFVNHVIRKTLRTNVANHIRNMINERARHDRNARLYHGIVSGHHTDMDTHVKVLSKLNRMVADLPVFVRGSVLYIMRYPDQLDRFIRSNDVATSYRILKCVFEIRKSLQMNNTDATLPESHCAKMLLLSRLYKHNPMALALFMEVKSVEKFYQLCKLAERNELSLPSAHEFNSIVEEILEMGSKLDSNQQLSVRDRQVLALMTTTEKDIPDITPTSEVVPVLAQYFVHSVSQILKSQETVQNRIIASLDVTDAAKVKKIYEVLAKEVSTQVRMVQEIIGAISTSESLNNVLKKLETKLTEK